MQFSNKQVLIVEDQRPFLLLLKGLMHSMGASDVVTKSSAEQAVSLCKKHKFDIVICDLHLGAENKNGYELIEELRTRRLIGPTSVFILISALLTSTTNISHYSGLAEKTIPSACIQFN